MGQLAQWLSRPSKVKILQNESSDMVGTWVAGDAEPWMGTGVGGVEPGGERVGWVRGGLKGKQGCGIWIRKRNRDDEKGNEG